MTLHRAWVIAALAAAACGDPPGPLATAEPGVVFTYPIDGQLDVPTGARVVVSFSDPVVDGAVGACTATSGAFCLVGPNGPVAATPEISEDGHTVSFPAGDLEPGVTYDVFVRSELAPEARNLPASGPLVSFTTRSSRPRAAAPALVAVNGGDPANPESLRPLFETSTIRLVFSEPLDSRSVALAAGSIELLNSAGSTVPATMFANGIHVAIDPQEDLTAGATYVLRLGSSLVDLGGQALAPTTLSLTPRASEGATPIPQVLKTRAAGDPGPLRSRSGATPNEIVIDKPLIGREVSQMLPSALATELGDPKALGGPIAFTIRKGQRLKSTGMDIALGGQIPVGLSTGDVWIELLTDGGGRLYRNPHHPAEQRPENERAPLYVDLSLDVAVYASDPNGNAVLTQTVLGLQGGGTAMATDGVLAIETVASMELGLLGVTTAPTNLVLELITDASAAPIADTTPPTIVGTYPLQSSNDHAVDDGIDIVFDEPIDIDRARAGGVRLEDTNGVAVASVLETHGSSIVVRPLQPLAYGRIYRVVFGDVADVAGNKLTAPNLSFTTQALATTDIPMTVSAVYPGAPCSLTGGSATSPGRCAGGDGNDDLYKPFALPANDPIEVAFTQPVRRSSVTRGTACGQGSVRVEELDGAGGCVNAVPGTLLVRERTIAFVPDVPWTEGTRYRLTLVSGGDEGCSAGELCGPGGAANFDPLSGIDGEGGGPALVAVFVGAPRSTSTHMLTTAGPFSDLNGSGTRDSTEQPQDDNRAALRVVGTTGDVDSASFEDPDCVPSTPERENCMFLSGAMPASLGEISTSCGSAGASCIPVTLAPGAMYGTSTSMSADAGISISTDTGTSIMRVREPASGPVMGHIVDRGGTPTFVLSLELYMDAPDMSIPLSDHDLHSKPLSVTLEGPMSFLPDGRIAIALSNTADLPVEITINAPLGIDGSVQLIVPAREMKLHLLSPAPRGGAR